MHVRIAAPLCLMWLVLWAPQATVRYAYHWDSSQYARGEDHFDIARHQPHPPGYPLWVSAARALRGTAGNPYTPQVILALVFTLAGLACFRRLTGDGGATLLLGFSPVVMLAAAVPMTYAVDLFASSLGAWLAWRWWQGNGRWAAAGSAALAVTMGFRPSGVAFLLPLLAYALYRLAKQEPWRAGGAAAAGAAIFSLWYVPTASSCGGFAAYSALNRAQFLETAGQTSALLGAPLLVHVKMLVEAALYLAMGAVALLPLAAARLRRGGGWRTQRGGLFYALWVAPCLLFLLLLHCPAAGYVVLLLPALVMLVCQGAGPECAGPRRVLPGVALALTAAWFPYPILLGTAPFTPVYLAMRSTPSLVRAIEDAQRDLRTHLDRLPGGQPVVVCLLARPEAPNLRTVTYDFPGIAWVGAADPRARQGATALLCDAAGPGPEMRALYPRAQRAGGNKLYSFWLTGDNELRR
jgi:hypothetical protein